MDDQDADVRTKASESLNRVIKNLVDSQSSRILIELYKELKQNGSSIMQQSETASNGTGRRNALKR